MRDWIIQIWQEVLWEERNNKVDNENRTQEIIGCKTIQACCLNQLTGLENFDNSLFLLYWAFHEQFQEHRWDFQLRHPSCVSN